MSTEAYPFQKETVYAIERKFNGRALVAHEMGLGKTLCALWFLRRQKLNTLPALVVCPANVKYTWEHEARHHTGFRPEVLEGRKPPSRTPSTIPMLTIVNYDILKYWIPHLEQYHFQTIILDESQMLMNRSTQRTKSSQYLASNIPYRLCLSGTPLTNRPADLWQTLHLIRPDLFPSFHSYAKRYCNPKLTPWGWDYSGASNLNQLHKILIDTCMIRYRKEDVLLELPPKVRRVVPIELSDRSQYHQARDNFISWLKDHYPKRVTRATRALQLTQLGYLIRLCGELKLPGVIDWANRFLEETNEKLVLFGVHQKVIAALAENIGAKSVTIDGSVTGKQRHAAVQQFQGDKNTRLFIGNIRAASVGITLTKSATVGFAELWWRPTDHMQAEDRIHRISQDRTAWIHYLIAGETIEETLANVLESKQEILRQSLDGGKGDNALNIYDQLLKELAD